MLDKQFCSLEISKKQLENYLVSIGYWGDSYLRERNAYILSPCAYAVSTKQQEKLSILGKAIYSSLSGVAERIHKLAIDVPRTREDQELMSIVTRSSRKLLSSADTFNGSTPPILKVDMVQDSNGNYYVVEVDAYNPRGLGFNALLDGNAMLGGSEIKTFNTTAILSEMILKFSPSGRIVYFISEYERYYEPSFMVLKKALALYGIELILVREGKCSGREVISTVSEMANGHVFMIPESLQDVILRNELLKAYKNEALKFFFPPKAYLGSKMLLPYLGNHPKVNGFIPETILMSKSHDISNIKMDKAWLLKAGQSSGMKGVVFSDLNKNDFQRCFDQEKNKKRPSWVLQKHIDQESLMLKTFTGKGECFEKYFLRVIAQVTADGVVGLDITGRKDRMVHGAPDCVMLPSVLQ